MPILLLLFGTGIFTIFKKAKQQRQLIIDQIRDIVHEFVIQSFVLLSMIVGAIIIFIVQHGLFLGLIYDVILLAVVYVALHLKLKELQPKYENINEYLKLHTGVLDDIHMMLKTDLDAVFKMGFGTGLAVIVALLFFGSGIAGLFFGGLIIAGIMYILGIINVKMGWTVTCEEFILQQLEILYEQMKQDAKDEAKNAIVAWWKS